MSLLIVEAQYRFKNEQEIYTLINIIQRQSDRKKFAKLRNLNEARRPVAEWSSATVTYVQVKVLYWNAVVGL